jgi:hypothetical protein
MALIKWDGLASASFSGLKANLSDSNISNQLPTIIYHRSLHTVVVPFAALVAHNARAKPKKEICLRPNMVGGWGINRGFRDMEGIDSW